MKDINRNAGLKDFFSKEARNSRKDERAAKKEAKEIQMYGDTAAYQGKMDYLKQIYSTSSTEGGGMPKTPLYIAGGIVLLTVIIVFVAKSKNKK